MKSLNVKTLKKKKKKDHKTIKISDYENLWQCATKEMTECWQKNNDIW